MKKRAIMYKRKAKMMKYHAMDTPLNLSMAPVISKRRAMRSNMLRSPDLDKGKRISSF